MLKGKGYSGKFQGIIRRNQKRPASCVLWKSVPENFQEIPKKSFTTEHISKAHSYTELELCRWCFSMNFPKIFRTAILKEKLPMDIPYFIKEHLWMSVSDEATQKYLVEVNPPRSWPWKQNGTSCLLRWFSKLWTTEGACYR